MGRFSIEEFAQGCKEAMEAGEDPEQAAESFLEGALREHEPAAIMEALEAAIPEGASLGEMIVHSSPELTMLYARVPPRFRSGVHNHTVFACMGQLRGEERSVLYERAEDGRGLRVTETVCVAAGQVMSLAADAIHHIENPNPEPGCSLHIYGGDFGALMDHRSLWSAEGGEELSFSFEGLVRQSVISMKKEGNADGLRALVEAMPALESLVDA